MNFDVFEYAETHNFGEIHMKMDQKTGLRAIIALHSTKLGPALGGCRYITYPDTQAAIYDAMRLARGMSYKAALVNIPHGGGKTVIMKTQEPKDRHDVFTAFGHFLNSLDGRYITAIDSGTSAEDMDIIAKVSPYVSSQSSVGGDTSSYTAKGVLRGIEAAVLHYLQKNSLEGIRVAIQGVGHVGYPLAKMLHELGVRLIVADTNLESVNRCVREFDAEAVRIDEIYQVDCDVFSPCALGAIINDDTLPQFKTRIIAGSANNQLAKTRHGVAAHELGIHYVPDYVINSGGLIYAAGKYDKVSDEQINKKIDSIHDSLLTIFERSTREAKPCSKIADKMAEEILC